MAAAKSRQTTTKQEPTHDLAKSVGTGGNTTSAAENGLPAEYVKPRQRILASVLIAGQLGLLLFSLLANLSPSILQDRISAIAGVYLVTTAQDYGAVPIELSHGEVLEVPMRIEVHQAGEAADRWTTLFPTPSTPAHQWPNVSRLMRLIATEIPDSEILSELVARAIAISSPRDVQDADYVRITAPYMASYDEFSIAGEGRSENIRMLYPDSVVFSAKIVQSSDGDLLLIPNQDPSRTSKSQRPPVAQLNQEGQTR